MLTISYHKLKYAAALFAVIPLLIFFFGWLHLPAAIILSVLLGTAFFCSVRQRKPDDGAYMSLHISWGTLAAIIFLAAVWCFLAGQGGFVHQTSDHRIRNMIITDLTLRPWPVTYHDGDNMLSYYIAYWMAPCGIGRGVFLLTGNEVLSLHFSNVCLLLQSTIGVALTLLLTVMITQTKGKAYPILAVLIFIFFSGLDTIGVALGDQYTRDIAMTTDHLEWWGLYFQFSSNSTLLYWVYNQTVTIWPLMLCLMNEKRLKDFAFLAVLAFPYGPFPFVGMVIFCLMRAVGVLSAAAKSGTLRKELQVMLSPQNFLTVLSIAPVFILYFTANGMVSNHTGNTEVTTSFRLHDAVTTTAGTSEFWYFWGKYLLFILLEFGIYTAILLVKTKKRGLLLANAVALAVIPLFQLGTSGDFGMRVSIPGLLYICIMMIRLIISEMPEKGEVHSLDDFARKRTALMLSCFALIIGSATPFCEITREILFTYEAAHPDPTRSELWSKFDYDAPESLDGQNQEGNFFAQDYQSSAFYTYFCKKI